MRLHRLDEITLDGTGLIARQGRLMGVVSTVVLGGVFTGAPFFWWAVGAPWIVWGVLGLLALLVVPMIMQDLVAKLRATNWLMWIRPDGIWINFRSYQDTGSCDAQTVVELDYKEIAEARQYVETFSTPGDEGGSTNQKRKSLELCLRHTDTEELQAAISEDRRRELPQRVCLGFIRVSSRPSHFPVSLPAPDVLRVAWRGGVGSWAVPSLSRVLAELSHRVCVAESLRDDRADWRHLSDEEFDSQVLDLVQAGSRIEAIELLVNRRGYTTTVAHQFVRELEARV